MKPDELKTKVEELESLIQTGNDLTLAETQARELLEAISTGEGLGEVIGEVELRTRILIVLVQSLGQRDMAKDALPYAEESQTLAEQTQNKELQTKTLVNIGNVYRSLSDYVRALEYYSRALSLNEELGNKRGVASILGNIGNVYYYLSDYPRALDYYGKALVLAEELGNKAAMATHFGNIGTVHQNLSDYARALEYMGKALSLNEELGNKQGVAIHLGNIGNVHLNLLDYPRALEYIGKALALDEELGNKTGVAIDLGNIANVYYYLSDYSRALEYMDRALSLNEELDNKRGVASILGNIGNVHQKLSDYARALEQMGKALALDEELDNKAGMATWLGNIGATYAKQDFDGYDPDKAEEYLLRAIDLSTGIGYKAVLIEFHKTLSDLYEQEQRLGDAFTHYKKHIAIKEEVNVEEVKKQEAIREQRKAIELAKAAADAKHQATEQLLHNVLPPTIAARMLDGTQLIAEKIPSVSVLFADIVNFTKLSQSITPEELVEGLDRIFSEFDALVEKHGLEKIKTIGDAYMVVAGAPEVRADHAETMANFALEMVAKMKEFRSISTGEEVQIRIGIHSGEVVAGVIGKKKFAYDLWGDAVNTASRMESHGEAGKIHCSADFMRAVETVHEPSLRFIPRGEMEIKGKGMMKTYFLEKLSEQD
jgi:adenylate cyclase